MNARICGLAIVVLVVACGGSVPPDEDGTQEKAKPLELDEWVDSSVECDDGEPDCNDWYAVELEHPGQLTVEVATVGDEDPGPFRLSLMDAGGLTIMETDSGGRRSSGLRWEAVRGTYYVWLRPTGTEEAEFAYRLRASMNRPPGSKAAGSSKSRRACVAFDASNDVNFYDGQAHVILLSIYPLSNKAGFESSSLAELISGADVSGLVGERRILQLAPGERKQFDETIPAEATTLGIAADYYQPRGSGEQKVVVDASCGEGGPRVHLTRGEALLD